MKIAIGGQMDKQKIADTLKQLNNNNQIDQIEIMSDIEAAMSVKSGTADLYLGACNTGGGGALAMAIALLGMEQCAVLSMPGNIKSNEEIKNEVKAGKKAFGFTAQHIDMVVPVLCSYLFEQK